MAELIKTKFELSQHVTTKKVFSDDKIGEVKVYCSVEFMVQYRRKNPHCCTVYFTDDLRANPLFNYNKPLPVTPSDLKRTSVIVWDKLFPVSDDNKDKAIEIARMEYRRLLEKAKLNDRQIKTLVRG